MPSPAKSKRDTVTVHEASPPEESVHVEAHENDQHLTMHTLHAKLPIPYFTPGDLASNTRTVTGWLPSPPPTKDLVYYGGLSALALAGAIEWPVALVVAGATWVVRGTREAPAHRPRPAHETESVPVTGTGS
ncbi:hypothetical protein ACVHNB_23700 [Streptomyces sp. YJ-C3]